MYRIVQGVVDAPLKHGFHSRIGRKTMTISKPFGGAMSIARQLQWHSRSVEKLKHHRWGQMFWMERIFLSPLRGGLLDLG